METFREKLGPLPVWGWLALITAAGLTWWLVSGRKQAAAAATTSAPASDVPQTVIQAPGSPVSVTVEDEDTDRERKRTKKAQRHKCPHGHHFQPGQAPPKGTAGGGLIPEGWTKVPGGWCVPDEKSSGGKITQPVLPIPRVPPAGRQPTNHEPMAA